jgi:tellurite resistance protein TerB
MSLFDRLQKGIQDLAATGEEFFSKVTNQSQFTRIVKACYLIGMADGDFDQAEKEQVARFLHAKFPQFSLQDAISVIADCDGVVGFNAEMGKLELIGDVTKASGDDAEAIIQIAIMIGKADGNFDDDEKALVQQLADGMEVNAGKYGL